MRRWLAGMPVLATRYLEWTNRAQRRVSVQGSVPLGHMPLGWAAVVVLAWLALAVVVHAERATATFLLGRIERHEVSWAVVIAIAAAMLVARRRALNRSAVPRAWTAALPVEPAMAGWQALVMDCFPALVLAGALAAVFGGLTVIGFVEPGLPLPGVTWGAIAGGVVAGAGLGRLTPKATPEALYEGSRYVPHRRVAGTRVPRGSLSALGWWPVRHVFASARPATIARTLIPVLLVIPLGAAAADVMRVVAMLVGAAALALLVVATGAVIAHARRWLMPLPLGAGVWVRTMMTRVLVVMASVACVEAWLFWASRGSGS